MPAVLAMPLFWGAVGAAATGTGAVVAGKMQASASRDAASQTTAAANHAADLQSQAADQALTFQREQGENAYQNSEVARHGNYDQWAAQQRKVRSVGQMLGLPDFDIPDYAPGVDPNLTGRPNPAAGAAGGNGNGVQAFMLDLLNKGVDPKAVADQTNAKFGASIGTGALYYPNNNTIGLPDFYIAGPQQGQTGTGWNVVTRGGGGPTTAAAPRSVGSYLTPYATPPMAPALAMSTRYGPGSVGSYMA
jgi:hypothetical protein